MIKTMKTASIPLFTLLTACADVGPADTTNEGEELTTADHESSEPAPEDAPKSLAAVYSLAGCSAHRANTAVWMDCQGGSERSWVKLHYKCKGLYGVTTSGSSDWIRVDPGQQKTVRAECAFQALDSWPGVRSY